MLKCLFWGLLFFKALNTFIYIKKLMAIFASNKFHKHSRGSLTGNDFLSINDHMGALSLGEDDIKQKCTIFKKV